MGKLSEKTFERLAGSDLKEDQFCWTFCLAELAKTALELVPDAATIAWSLISSRIKGMLPEDDKGGKFANIGLTIEQEANIVWWRNCIFCKNSCLNAVIVAQKGRTPYGHILAVFTVEKHFTRFFLL